MKKVYTTPNIEVTNLNLAASIIETSGKVQIGSGSASGSYSILSKELDIDAEDESDEW